MVHGAAAGMIQFLKRLRLFTPAVVDGLRPVDAPLFNFRLLPNLNLNKPSIPKLSNHLKYPSNPSNLICLTRLIRLISTMICKFKTLVLPLQSENLNYYE